MNLHPVSDASPARRGDKPARDSSHLGPGPATLRITVLDCQLAEARNEPTGGVTLTELLVAALKAKQADNHPRALLFLGLVNRRLAECQLDAARELAREHTEAEL